MDKIIKFFVFLIIISPICAYWEILGVSLAPLLSFVSTVPLIGVVILFKNIKFKHKYLLSLSVICAVLVILLYRHLNICIVSGVELFKAYISLLANILLIILIRGNNMVFMRNFVYSVYEKILILSALVSITQFFSYHVFDVLLFVPNQHYLTPVGVRSCGLFGEPAHFGVFASLYALVPQNYTKYSNVKLLVILIGLVFSFSAVSYIALLLIILSAAIRSRKIKYIIFFSVIFLMLMPILINLPQFQRPIESFVAIKEKSNVAGVSTYTRVWLGYDIYNHLETNEKLWGVGPGSIGYVKYVVDSLPEEYMNGFFNELSSLGLVFVIFINIFLFIMLRPSCYALLTLFKLGTVITIFTPGATYIYLILAFVAADILSKKQRKGIARY